MAHSHTTAVLSIDINTMSTLHTFGCSITQGYALPDVVNPIRNAQGVPLTEAEIEAQGIPVDWNKIHIYKPSQFAWPQVLADRLGMDVINHARRGACFQQIARQCTVGVGDIKPDDVIIVMWTYLQRLSLQWPARTTVPFANQVDPAWGWRTVMLGFNRLLGLSPAENTTEESERHIQDYIERATRETYLDPMGQYNRYYNAMVLQCVTAGFLQNTGARVIHLSVEAEPCDQQLEQSRQELLASLREPYTIPHPRDWYHIPVDHRCVDVIFDPRIPLAENDMHPSVTHHRQFAEWLLHRYFA